MVCELETNAVRALRRSERENRDVEPRRGLELLEDLPGRRVGRVFVDLDVASSWEPPLSIPVVDKKHLSSIGVGQHAVGNEVLRGCRRFRCSEDLIAAVDPPECVEAMVDLSGIVGVISSTRRRMVSLIARWCHALAAAGCVTNASFEGTPISAAPNGDAGRLLTPPYRRVSSVLYTGDDTTGPDASLPRR